MSDGWNQSCERAVHDLKARSPHFHWVGIYLLQDQHLQLGPYVGAPTDHTRIAVGQGVCGTAIAENRDLNIPDVKACTNYLACSVETRSELVVLIREASGQVIGQIDIDSHTPDAFGPKEEKQVKAVALQLGQLWDELKSQKSSRH